MRDKMENKKSVDATENASEKSGESTRQSGAMVKISNEIVIPDVSRAQQAMQAFENLKRNLLLENDKAEIMANGKKIEVIKRSGFSKIALAFGVSTWIEKINRIKTDNDYIVHVIARASFPGGRYAEANASCSASEFGNKSQATVHNIESKAGTRATNRAISNLVGGGTLSAEEFESDVVVSTSQPSQVASRPQARDPSAPASTPQKNLIKGLAEKKDKEHKDQVIADLIGIVAPGKKIEELTMGEASAIIDRLQGKI